MERSRRFASRLVAVGGLSRIELKESLSLFGVRLNASAETLLEDPIFDSVAARTVSTIAIVECSVADLGLDEGASLTRILARAREKGLTPCPPFAGPYLRLSAPDQASAPDSVMSNGHAPTGSVTIASERLRAEYGYPRGFYLRVVDKQHWLRGYRCAEDASWRPDDRFMFQSQHHAGAERRSRPLRAAGSNDPPARDGRPGLLSCRGSVAGLP